MFKSVQSFLQAYLVNTGPVLIYRMTSGINPEAWVGLKNATN